MLVVRDGSGVQRWRDERVHAIIIANLPVGSGFHTREIKGGYTREHNVFCKTAASHTGVYPARDTRVRKAKIDTWGRRLNLCGGYRVHRMKAHRPIRGMCGQRSGLTSPSGGAGSFFRAPTTWKWMARGRWGGRRLRAPSAGRNRASIRKWTAGDKPSLAAPGAKTPITSAFRWPPLTPASRASAIPCSATPRTLVAVARVRSGPMPSPWIPPAMPLCQA
jgi:hypothetical protein